VHSGSNQGLIGRFIDHPAGQGSIIVIILRKCVRGEKKKNQYPGQITAISFVHVLLFTRLDIAMARRQEKHAAGIQI